MVKPLTVDHHDLASGLTEHQLEQFSVLLVAELCAKILVVGSHYGYSELPITPLEFIGFKL